LENKLHFFTLPVRSFGRAEIASTQAPNDLGTAGQRTRIYDSRIGDRAGTPLPSEPAKKFAGALSSPSVPSCAIGAFQSTLSDAVFQLPPEADIGKISY
jgi:hypothetical protein